MKYYKTLKSLKSKISIKINPFTFTLIVIKCLCYMISNLYFVSLIFLLFKVNMLKIRLPEVQRDKRAITCFQGHYQISITNEL